MQLCYLVAVLVLSSTTLLAVPMEVGSTAGNLPRQRPVPPPRTTPVTPLSRLVERPIPPPRTTAPKNQAKLRPVPPARSSQDKPSQNFFDNFASEQIQVDGSGSGGGDDRVISSAPAMLSTPAGGRPGAPVPTDPTTPTKKRSFGSAPPPFLADLNAKLSRGAVAAPLPPASHPSNQEVLSPPGTRPIPPPKPSTLKFSSEKESDVKHLEEPEEDEAAYDVPGSAGQPPVPMSGPSKRALKGFMKQRFLHMVFNFDTGKYPVFATNVPGSMNVDGMTPYAYGHFVQEGDDFTLYVSPDANADRAKDTYHSKMTCSVIEGTQTLGCSVLLRGFDPNSAMQCELENISTNVKEQSDMGGDAVPEAGTADDTASDKNVKILCSASGTMRRFVLQEQSLTAGPAPSQDWKPVNQLTLEPTTHLDVPLLSTSIEEQKLSESHRLSLLLLNLGFVKAI